MKIVNNILFKYNTFSSPHIKHLEKPKRDIAHSGVKLQDNTGVNYNYRPAQSESFGGSVSLMKNKKQEVNTSDDIYTSPELEEIKRKQQKKKNTVKAVVIASGILGTLAAAGGMLMLAHKKGWNLPKPVKAVDDNLTKGLGLVKKGLNKLGNNPLGRFVSEKLQKHRDKVEAAMQDKQMLKELAETDFDKYVDEMAKRAGSKSIAMMKNKGFRNTVKFSFIKEAVFSAFITFGIGMFIKPAFVLAMPGADEKDKQMIATKNIVSAMVSFILSNIIMNPISDAVQEVIKHPHDYIKKNERAKEFATMIENEVKLPGHGTDMKETVKGIVKNMPEIGIVLAKSAITVALIPVVLNLLFGEKNKKSDKNKPLPMELVYIDSLNKSNNTQNNIFKKVSGGLSK